MADAVPSRNKGWTLKTLLKMTAEIAGCRARFRAPVLVCRSANSTNVPSYSSAVWALAAALGDHTVSGAPRTLLTQRLHTKRASLNRLR